MPRTASIAPASTPAVDRPIGSRNGHLSAPSTATCATTPSGSIGWMTGNWTPMASEAE